MGGLRLASEVVKAAVARSMAGAATGQRLLANGAGPTSARIAIASFSRKVSGFVTGSGGDLSNGNFGATDLLLPPTVKRRSAGRPPPMA